MFETLNGGFCWKNGCRVVVTPIGVEYKEKCIIMRCTHDA